MALTFRPGEDLEQTLKLVCKIDGVRQNDFLKAATEVQIAQRLEDPEFQTKLQEYLKPMTDMMKGLGVMNDVGNSENETTPGGS